MARARLDPNWWKTNKPQALKPGALQQALEDFAKVSRSLERSGDVAAYFKAVSRVKAAIAKDTQVLRKAKDKAGLKLLGDLEKQAHNQSQSKQKQLTIQANGIKTSGLSGTAAGRVPSGSTENTPAITGSGDRRWAPIRNSQVNSGAKSKSCAALPKGHSVRDLTGWSTEQVNWSSELRVEGKTAPLTVKFRLEYSWGGHLPSGGGAYLSDCRLWVTDLRVPWGYSVEAEVDVGSAFNSGSRSEPVGAVPLTLNLQVQTELDRVRKSWTIRCHGNKKREIK